MANSRQRRKKSRARTDRQERQISIPPATTADDTPNTEQTVSESALSSRHLDRFAWFCWLRSHPKARKASGGGGVILAFWIAKQALDYEIDGAVKTAGAVFLAAWAVLAFAIYVSNTWDKRRPFVSTVWVLAGMLMVTIWWAYLPSPPTATVSDKVLAVPVSEPPAPTPYILTRLVIDSVSEDDTVFHFQVDNGELPIRDIRAAYSTTNFNIDPDMEGQGFFEVSTVMPRMLPPRGTLSIPGQSGTFARDRQTDLTVMIGYSAEISSTTSRDFTATYRFVVRPEDRKPQVIHPEGVETKEQEFHDDAMQSRLAAESFLTQSGMIRFYAPETRGNGEPNILHDENQYRSFVFNPITRLVTFKLKISSGRLISLELPLSQRNGQHWISLGWNYSEGGFLIVDGIATRDINGKTDTFVINTTTPKSK